MIDVWQWLKSLINRTKLQKKQKDNEENAKSKNDNHSRSGQSSRLSSPKLLVVACVEGFE